MTLCNKGLRNNWSKERILCDLFFFLCYLFHKAYISSYTENRKADHNAYRKEGSFSRDRGFRLIWYVGGISCVGHALTRMCVGRPCGMLKLDITRRIMTLFIHLSVIRYRRSVLGSTDTLIGYDNWELGLAKNCLYKDTCFWTKRSWE